MKKAPLITILVVLALVIGALTWSLTRPKDNDTVSQITPDTSTSVNEPTNTTPPSTETPVAETPQATNNRGRFVEYYPGAESDESLGKKVLFFNAKWCPTCKALTTDINANKSTIPQGTTVISVDYDTYNDLKKRYGVTYQHTLVQVNNNGEQVKKWSGSPSLSSLLSEIQ